MTIVAGVFSRSAAVSVPESVCVALKRAVSRDSSDHRIEFQLSGAYMVKVDIGAFGAPAHHVSDSGAVSVLAGEPLVLTGHAQNQERDEQLRFLHTEWERDSFQSLRWSSGTFCAAFYDPARATGHLVADRLGLRTLYYAVTGDFVYFASALRILEGLEELPKTLDVKALVEITGFGYPFGAGTPYSGVKMLLPSEVLTISSGEVSSSQYFDWNSIEPLKYCESDTLEETYRLFSRAIRRRLGEDKTSFAYLSGGLDSRCVVAALRAEQVHTYTFNFSLGKTQDQVFALQYAERCGAIHHELPTEPGPNWSAVMSEAWAATPKRKARDAERPHLVWTGEGGSVGLGHVYITPEIVVLLRAGDWDGGIDTFLRQQSKSVLSRILKPDVAKQFAGHLQACLRSELLSIRQPDPVRALYIFLNLNGPRRHLVNHFETIDQHRLEFQLPFYDSELLEYLTALPVDPFLYHEFYGKWLSRFDSSVIKVPWQAYPGHAPSPVPAPTEIPDQWSTPASKAQRTKLRSELDAESKAMLADAEFPSNVLSRSILGVMWVLWRSGLRNYDYSLKTALVYFKYFKRSVRGGLPK